MTNEVPVIHICPRSVGPSAKTNFGSSESNKSKRERRRKGGYYQTWKMAIRIGRRSIKKRQDRINMTG